MGNSGKVLMIFKGDYNASTTYQKLNVVYYNNRSYVCKQTSTGNVPTNTTYWQALTGDASAEIQALTNYVAENNVKNILHETITTRTVGGVTFTVNSDGSITLEGTCNETASVNIAEYFPIKAGDYVYSKGATTGSAIMYLYDTATFADIAYTADHVEFSIASDRQIMARFYIVNGTTYNATVYPMIVAKSVYDADPTYQPYAKTNVELTQALPVIEFGTTAFTDGNEKVNFTKTFSAAPTVMAIPKYTTVTTGETPLLLKVYDVTTTYFRVRAIDNTGANVSSFTNATSFMWQAML